MLYLSPINPYYYFRRGRGSRGEADEVDRGAAMLAVVLDVYEGWQGLDRGLEAEGARGKRARNRWHRRAQTVLRGALDWFVPPGEDNPRT
jgi:hypothetical protein